MWAGRYPQYNPTFQTQAHFLMPVPVKFSTEHFMTKFTGIFSGILFKIQNQTKMVFLHVQVNVFAIISQINASGHHCALIQQFIHIYVLLKTLFQTGHQVQVNLIRVSIKVTSLVHQSWHLIFGISQTEKT